MTTPMAPEIEPSTAPADYTDGFYPYHRDGSRRSARRILPIVLGLLPGTTSVVDVGCGDGNWLRVLQEDHGISDITGIDGDYVDRADLQIPADRFIPYDLTQPLRLPTGRRFGLAMSVEVAEHLPADSADGFVASLAALSDAVLFSAACPMQGGTNHINEQWPEYWATRFARHGLVPVDAIRPAVWGDDAVQPWYAQNALLYVRRHLIDASPALRELRARTNDRALAMVHPRIFLHAVDFAHRQLDLARNPSLRQTLGALPTMVARAVGRRLHSDGAADGSPAPEQP